MPRLRAKQDLADLASLVVAGNRLATYKGDLYVAKSFKDGGPLPPPGETVWAAVDKEELMDWAQAIDLLFYNQQEFYNWVFMIKQMATRERTAEPYVVIRDGEGISYMTDIGLVPVVKPAFAPNFINHKIIDRESEDYKHVESLFRTVSDWVGGDAQAHSLLYHLATALQPGWTPVKYILLLGKGRNGKGTLLKMLAKLLGDRNLSGVLRQDIAARKSIVASVNGKLANIVFDGPASYVAESGPEKTLTAGEPLIIELKYENEPRQVQTNCLWIEALNKEPKNRDQTYALQSRLVRWQFKNRYAKDLGFEAWMTSDTMINALLTLLWEHWVRADEIADKLAVTEESEDLQSLTELNTSPVLAFIEFLERRESGFVEKLKTGKFSADEFVDAYQPWLTTQGYGERSLTAIWEQLSDHFQIERGVVRVDKRPKTVKLIKQIQPSTLRALTLLEGDASADAAVVREE